MMTIEEAKEILSYHSCRNEDIDNPKWENGFLGSLRPFRRVLFEENFIEVMQCMKILKCEFSSPNIDKNMVSDIFAITHLTRSWSAPWGMLGSNNLLTEEQKEQLLEWVEIIEICLFYLFEGCEEEAFWDYNEYLKEHNYEKEQ